MKGYLKWCKDIIKHPIFFVTHDITKKDSDEYDRLLKIVNEKGSNLLDYEDDDVKAFHEHSDKMRHGLLTLLANVLPLR